MGCNPAIVRASCRSLGDASGGERVLCDPSVHQITLDVRGARLIVASDGVWDAVGSGGGKGVAHRVRNMACTKAASNIRSHSKDQRDRDDITVIVADFVADLDLRVPLALAEPAPLATKGAHGSGAQSSGDCGSSMTSVARDAKSKVRSPLL
jgi:Protein phosphatase 2C